MTSTNQFVTAASIGTFSGATGAVWAVSNALRRAFNIDRPYIPLLVSIVVAYVIVISSGSRSVLDYALALVNACLLFLSAAGLQQAANADLTSGRGTQRHGRQRVSWFTPWIQTRERDEVIKT
jgi:hypothetical protein